MADERPSEETPRQDEPGTPADPLISQSELDQAIAEAQESIRRAREAAKLAIPSSESRPRPAPGPDIVLPPDLGVLRQDELNEAVGRHFSESKSAPGRQPESKPASSGEVAGPGSQDEIDRLLRSVQDETAAPALGEVPCSPPDMDESAGRGQSVIGQKELDGAVENAEEASRRRQEQSKADAPPTPAGPPPEPPPVSLPPDLGAVTQGELDHAVDEHATGSPQDVAPEPHGEDLESVASSAAEDESVDRDDIDTLLKAINVAGAAPDDASATPPLEPEDATPPPPMEATPEPINTDAIDRDLTEGQPAASAPAPDWGGGAEFGQMDQDAIDRLIREAAEQVAADGLASSVARRESPVSDEAKPDSTPDSSAAGEVEAESLAQDDIDALLTSLTGPAETDDKAELSGAPEAVAQEPSAPIGSPPQPEEDTAGESEQLGQEDLDQLLSAMSPEDSLVDRELDEPLTDSAALNGADMEAEVLSKGDSGAQEPAAIPTAVAERDMANSPPVEDPVERANRGAAESEVGSENLAAAVPQVDDLLESIVGESGGGPERPAPSEKSLDEAAIPAADELSQEFADGAPDDAALGRDDMVVQLGDEEIADLDLQGADKPSVVRKDFRRSVSRDLRKHVVEYLRSGSLKTWGSLAAGILCTIATFLFLQSNQQRMPHPGIPFMTSRADADEIVRSARELIAMEKYDEAQALLEPVVKNAQAAPSLAEAHALYIESRFRRLSEHITDREAESLHRDIDELVGLAPAFRRNPELLRWKASLYERSGAMAAALSTYKLVADEYADATGGDETLIAAARLAGKMNRPEETEQFLVRLLQRFPASPHAPEAKLLLGDTQRDAGMLDDARKLYTQVALSQDFSPLGAEATTRLAKLELDQGNYNQAIAYLERRLETATTVQGNDAIYLLLAKAYRGNGDPDKAETLLRELIGFFPESEHTAAGFVELSQTLDEIGNRREALKIAAQASQRFPEDPQVLINEGELLQRSGEDGQAAKTFLDAVEAGGNDPHTLLAAGRAFARVNELAKARQTFDRLLTDFPTAPEAFEGSIQLANVLQKQGQSQAALERLTNLADASAGKPQQISLLLALGDLYDELGFRERAAQQYEDAAALTNDPGLLAKSAVALIDAGNAGPGLAVARRVNASGLPPELGYTFLSAYGKALLQMDSAMALEKMQQAYEGYPDYRTEEGDRALLRAYLVTGQTARARALVMDLSGYARSHPDSGPRLQRTAIQWADALFNRGDYTAASQAYALAVEAAPEKQDADWARFQQANALMKLDDYEKSLELLETVAGSSSPFAEDARLKAEYARLEQRLRGDQMPTQMGG